MALFKDFYNASDSVLSLGNYIGSNMDRIASFSYESRAVQESEVDDFEEFVLLKLQLLMELDYRDSNNKAFVYYLIDYCVRFRSGAAFIQLYQIIKDNSLVVGSRINAAITSVY